MLSIIPLMQCLQLLVSAEINRSNEFKVIGMKNVEFHWINILIHPVASAMLCPSLREERGEGRLRTSG